jgi:hypothetical protein
VLSKAGKKKCCVLVLKRSSLKERSAALSFEAQFFIAKGSALLVGHSPSKRIV